MDSQKPYWTNFYPPGVRHNLIYPDVPIYYFLENAARKYPNNTATIFMGAKLTYTQLKDHVDRFATALSKLGIKKGDRVAIILPNCPQAVIAYYAILRLGAIAIQNNPLYMERELSHQLKDCGAETIIFLDLVTNKVLNVLPSTNIKNLIVTSIKDYLPFPISFLYPFKAKKEGTWVDVPKDRGIMSFKTLINNNPPSPPEVEVNPEDLALLQYTGGTTGLSKGAMLTHRNLVANVIQIREWLTDCQEGKEIMLAVLPFFHVYGMTVEMNFTIHTCGTLILVPRFVINDVLKTIDKYKPTLFPGAPTMYVAVINHPEVSKYDLKSIKACISGAAPLPAEVQQKFEALTGGKLVEGYGLTETSPVTHCNNLVGQRYPGSIGLPFPDTQCKIADLESGESELPMGEAGELCLKGPQVMKGYWNMPEETMRCLSDGWFKTGDIAKMDEKGLFYIVDRKKDMVIAGGYNIYPREVEEVIYEHPMVKEAVVAGVPDRYRGETLKAYIILKEGQTTTDKEIIEFCQQRLARYKVPKVVEFRDELPKTMIGKILRRMLVEEEKNKLKQ